MEISSQNCDQSSSLITKLKKNVRQQSNHFSQYVNSWIYAKCDILVTEPLSLRASRYLSSLLSA